MKIVKGIWNAGIRNTVESQIIRNKQAPHKEEITGIKE